MTIALTIIGSAASVIIAAAALFSFGVDPVAALVLFWLGGLAATLVIAGGMIHRASEASVEEDQSDPAAQELT